MTSPDNATAHARIQGGHLLPTHSTILTYSRITDGTTPILILVLSVPENMAHTSVASKRLFQEYKALLTAPPDGITAGPVNEEDLFVWEALIQGPEGTPFEGGIFPAELKFPKDYPLNPPKMKFLGEIW